MVSGRWADMWIHECISDFIPFLFLFSYTEGCRQQMGETDWVFWSQQWNICFNSFILGLQVGILNQIQSNLVGKPMCVCVCVCVCVCACMCVCACSVVSDSLQPHGLSLPGSSIHGIFQARLEWVPMPCPGDGSCVSCVSCIGRWILYHWATCALVIIYEQNIRKSRDGQGKGLKTACKDESPLKAGGEERKGLAAPELRYCLCPVTAFRKLEPEHHHVVNWMLRNQKNW